MRTHVTFLSSAFNTARPKVEFINPENYGDDLAEWLLDQMTSRQVPVDPEIGQEDHGWYFTFTFNRNKYDLIVGSRDGDWVCWIERVTGLMSSLFGGRKKGIETGALTLVDDILRTSQSITAIRWHHEKAFMQGNEDGSPSPLDP